MRYSEIIHEDLDHSNRYFFHGTTQFNAMQILATGILKDNTIDKATIASGKKGVSLTRSYHYALSHSKGLSNTRVIFVLKNITGTEPVDYWAQGPQRRRRMEAEEWHAGPILLRNHLVSINSKINIEEIANKYKTDFEVRQNPPNRLEYLYGDDLPAIEKWVKGGYKKDIPFWNRWKPIRGIK